MRNRSLEQPRSRLKPLCRLLQAAALGSSGLVFAPPAMAADIGWAYANSFWTIPGAWDLGVPGVADWAVFGVPTGAVTASFVNGPMGVAGVRFGVGATATLSVQDLLAVENGFVNEDAGLRSVHVAPATGEIRIGNGGINGTFGFTNEGRIAFENASTAGTAATTFLNLLTGQLDFEATASAGQANIINDGDVNFSAGSTAGNATVLNQPGGTVLFVDASTAGASTITSESGSFLAFSGTATAGTANITSRGTFGFHGNATAGNAIINTDGPGITLFHDDASGGAAVLNVTATGRLGFVDRSTAANATFNNGGDSVFVNDARAGSATVYNGPTGMLRFMDSATADSASITNDGLLAFSDTSSAGAATIVTRAGATTAFAGDATGGTARIAMQGGTLDLTGHNGLVTVGSLEGTGVVDVAGGRALMVGTLHTDTVFHGEIIGGGGALGKTGTGTLTLTGANTYSASTFIESGTLQIGEGGTTGSIATNVINNGTLAFNRSDGLVFGGTISGTGRVDVRGLGVVLTADNSYTGGTTIHAGSALQVGIGGATGSIAGDVVNNGRIYFERSDVVTFPGRISGSGELTSAGAGLVLTGDNSYTGETVILAPLMVGDGGTTGSLGTGPVTNDAVLFINRSGTLHLPNAIGGSGGLGIIGPGNVVLGGASTYTLGTVVDAGTLTVNGSIVGDTTVHTGGTLAGTGRTGNVTIESGGTLAPGNSIGTLTVAGNLRFDAGSRFQVETDSAGNADRVDATGTATIAGGTVDVRAGVGTYARNTSYTLLTAAGGRTGEFDSVSTDLAFLTPTLRYDAGAVLLDLQANRAGYGSVALTPNQHSVADYLQAFAEAPGTPEAATLVTQIDSLDAPGARRAFDNLSGSAHAVASQVATAVGRKLSATMAARTGFSAAAAGGSAATALPTRLASLDADRWDPAAVVATDAPPQAAGFATAVAGAAGARNTGPWVQLLGGGGSSDSNGNGPSSDYRNGGLVLGYDLPVATGWVAGAALGYVRSTWDADTGGTANASGKLESPLVGLYARYAQPAWRLHLDASYVRHDFEAERRVAVGGSAQTARSAHDGHELGLSAQMEFPRPWGDWEMAPLVGLRHARLSEDGFTETGAGAGNLTVASRSTDQTVVSAGLQFARRFASGQGGVELRAVGSHLFGDADAAVSSQLAGQAARFTARGTPLKRNALTLGATLSGPFSRKVSGYLDAAYELRGSGQNAYGVAAGVRVRW